ncbi:MAG: hypothetical protein PHV82_13765, partial [Victivallaceae bacterium]|nr:hypothetical protein [Victivallaceae bacterium]
NLAKITSMLRSVKVKLRHFYGKIRINGVFCALVRLTGGQKVGGSNPLIPTIFSPSIQAQKSHSVSNLSYYVFLWIKGKIN